MADWAAMIFRIGAELGFWPQGSREIAQTQARYRPGSSHVSPLRVGYEKLREETGWSRGPVEDGLAQTIRWYAANREKWIGRVDWLGGTQPTVRASSQIQPALSSHGGRGEPRPYGGGSDCFVGARLASPPSWRRSRSSSSASRCARILFWSESREMTVE